MSGAWIVASLSFDAGLLAAAIIAKLGSRREKSSR